MSLDLLDEKNFLTAVNLTPLVDVVFVLLIIFMVAAPLMIQGVEVDLPSTRTVTSLPVDSEHIVISLEADGDIFVDETPVELSGLAAMLTQAPAGRAVYLRADGDARHRDVVRVMGEIKAAGHDRLGIVAEPEDHATQP